LPQSVSLGVKMAYKVSVIVLMVTLVFLTLKYWRAKEEKDNCYINLDKHIKFIKENDKDAKQNKETYEKFVHSKEIEISDLKKDKTSAESKLKLCESSGNGKDKEIRIKEAALVEKDAAIKDKNKDLDEMIEKYGRLKNEYDKLVSSEKKLQSENDLLETHLSNSKNEIETLEDKVKKAAIQAKDDKIKLDAALSAKKDNSKEKEKEKVKVNDSEKAINKIADPIKKPVDIDDENNINRKDIDDAVDKKEKALSENIEQDKQEVEEEEDDN